MKPKSLFFILFVFIGFFSCEGNNENDNNIINNDDDNVSISYCIRDITDDQGEILLSDSVINLVKHLFDNNSLDYNNYQFYRASTSTNGYHHIMCHQFVKGLKVFYYDLGFHFDEDGMLSSGPFVEYKVSTIGLDTVRNMNQNKLVEIFIDHLKKDTFHDYKNMKLDTCCFDVEFGFYDLNDKKFTKAWKVTLKDQRSPHVFIDDCTSKTILYDNGVRDY